MQKQGIHKALLFFVVALCMAFLLPEMSQQGMFMDGTIYAAIARNLSIHQGSFWQPKFSDTIFPLFYDHPPLAFGLQALFFKVLGDGFYVEKFYGLCCALLTAVFIVRIWKHLFANHPFSNFYYLPVLLWMITPKVAWSFNNNMLENTLTLFTTAATYFLLKSAFVNFSKSLIYIIPASLLILAAFLSKGFPGLFPMGIYFLMYLSAPFKLNFKRMIQLTLLLFILFLLASVIVCWCQPAAIESITLYLKMQVFNSINGGDRVGSRWMWLYDYLQQLIPMIAFLIIALFFNRPLFFNVLRHEKLIRGNALLMFAIGLAASLPLMISPKLSAYYLVPCFPFIAMAFAVITAPILESGIQKINTSSKFPKRFMIFNLSVIVMVCLFSIVQFGHKYRDEALQYDIEKLKTYMPSQKTISIGESMYQDWRLIAYFQRNAQININREPVTSKFLLLEKNQSPSNGNYKKLALDLVQYNLFERIDETPKPE